ncbi:MAG: 23S rRNA pseudouridine(955/2504/2580) synthase RluC [Gammaproteobacteria bacterium]|nr:23S rRNA pseudouridine(955/2504/2580) synthase RluC [Gammaproteobacteria bacterium]
MSQINYPKVQMITVDEGSDGQRIDNYLIKVLKGVPKTRIYRIIRKGEVRVNKGRIKQTYRLKLDDVVRIPPIRMTEADGPVKVGQEPLQRLQQSIIFEDSRFLILNKPSGMAVHGGSGLSYGVIEGLRALRPDAPYLELAHRLDRETSGCLVVAKRRSALRGFQMLQQEGGVDKHYVTLLKGEWQGKQRKIDLPLMKNELRSGERVVRVNPQGKQAISIFTPIQKFANATLMRVKLITGRTHQIRVHAQHSGHPIAGDPKYGDEPFNREMATMGLKRLFLHAESIHFTLPDVMTYNISAPLDPKLEQVLNILEES